MSLFRACTYNLRYGTAEDGGDAWEHRGARLLDHLGALAPDVLGTQEGLPFQLAAIQARFPNLARVGLGRFHGVDCARPQERGEGEGCAIFFDRVRFSLVHTWTRWLSETPDRAGTRSWGAQFPRVLTAAALRCHRTGRVVEVFNTHLDWGEPFLAGAAALIGRWLAEVPVARPALLMGDFNVDAGHPLRAALCALPLAGGRRLGDALAPFVPAATRPTRHDFTGRAQDRIDWLLCTPELRAHRAWTDTWAAAGRFPSDHFPVLADLELSAEEPR